MMYFPLLKARTMITKELLFEFGSVILNSALKKMNNDYGKKTPKHRKPVFYKILTILFLVF